MPDMLNIARVLKEKAKALVFRHTSLAAPSYRYNIEPIQLAYLILEIERLKHVQGNIVEIGVARGLTTRFLAQHIQNQKMDQALTLYAVDTFESFTEADVAFEVNSRGKSAEALDAFKYNDYEVWQKNFSDFKFVKAIKSDCSLVDYDQYGPIKVAFLDVDLYLPTQKTLPKLFKALVSGGVILVDDVLQGTDYDGAYQAYTEFCKTIGQAPEIIGNKCGIIRKP
jgi:predicted O-methyltransferase YrrM